MKRWHKFVLVLSVFSVLFTSLSVSTFANSLSDYGEVSLKPLFAPLSVSFYDGDDVANFSLFSTVITSIDVGSGFEGATELYDANDTWGILFFSSSDAVSGSSDIYSLSFDNRVEFNTGVYSPNIVEFAYNDYYYYGNSVSDQLSRHFNSSFSFKQSGVEVPISSLLLSCDIVYLDSDRLSTDSFSISSVDYNLAFGSLENYLFDNYPDGALLTNISVLIDFDSEWLTEILFSGTVRYVEDDSLLGAAAALDSWSDRYGDTIINDTPTILESVRIGLDAVWNTSLFGLFTIGQVFSACAGLALFTWLLKIFNR